MKTDIIIPHYGLTDRLTQLCTRCLETIREHTRDYRLIFVDNGSPQFAQILPELERHPHVLVRNSENVGFVKAVNQGLKLSSADQIVILNNDTEAVEGWIEKLSGALHGMVGVVGPRTTTHLSWQGRVAAAKGVRVLPEGSMLAFFCVMIRRDVFEVIGLLDEDFGAGFGDDDDYCWRLQQKGYQLGLVQDLLIPHHHRSSFKALYSWDEITVQQWENYAIHFCKKAPTMAKEAIEDLIPKMREPVAGVLREELARRG